MMDMLMCRSCQRWICSCLVVVNGEYDHVKSWSMMDVLMCSSGQYRIWSCKVVVIVDMLMFSGDQWRDIRYAHVLEWSMQWWIQ